MERTGSSERLRARRSGRARPERDARTRLVRGAAFAGIAVLASTVGVLGAPPAGADVTQTDFNMACFATDLGLTVGQSNPDSITVDAPASVPAGSTFTMTIQPAAAVLFKTVPAPGLGSVNNRYINKLKLDLQVPTNATLVSASVAPGTGFGLSSASATPRVDTNATDPLVPVGVIRLWGGADPLVGTGNGLWYGNATDTDLAADWPYQLPAVSLELTASGAPGTFVQPELKYNDGTAYVDLENYPRTFAARSNALTGRTTNVSCAPRDATTQPNGLPISPGLPNAGAGPLANVLITGGPSNNPPTADAGPDQSGVTAGQTVTLDATGSSDPDSDPLSFLWTQTDGPLVALSDDTAAQPTFTAPAGPATLTFEVAVDDGNGGTDTDSVTVDVAAPAGPTVGIGDASVWEGDSKARTVLFPVTVSAPSNTAFSVQYRIVTGTAGTSDIDDKQGAIKTLSFKPGSSGLTAVSKKIAVKVLPDTDVEGDEQFTVELVGVSGGGMTLGRSVGQGTVLDDDAGSGLRVGIGSVSVVEGDTGVVKMQVRLTLSSPAPGPVSVTMTPQDLSAVTGVDYKLLKPKTLTFKTGAFQKVVSVTILPNDVAQADRVFHLVLTDPVGMTIEGTGVGVATILDDD